MRSVQKWVRSVKTWQRYWKCWNQPKIMRSVQKQVRSVKTYRDIQNVKISPSWNMFMFCVRVLAGWEDRTVPLHIKDMQDTEWLNFSWGFQGAHRKIFWSLYLKLNPSFHPRNFYWQEMAIWVDPTEISLILHEIGLFLREMALWVNLTKDQLILSRSACFCKRWQIQNPKC